MLLKKPFDIYAGRLLILSTYLENLAPERFEFTHFVSPEWEGAQDLSCGATACGLGHAVVLFGEECGVEFVRGSRDFYEEGTLPKVKGTKLHGARAAIEAAHRMFDVGDEHDFERLFVPYTHPYELPKNRLSEDATAKDLAAHIRKFVKERYEDAPAGL
jgi:hypothetical protein